MGAGVECLRARLRRIPHIVMHVVAARAPAAVRIRSGEYGIRAALAAGAPGAGGAPGTTRAPGAGGAPGTTRAPGAGGAPGTTRAPGATRAARTSRAARHGEAQVGREVVPAS